MEANGKVGLTISVTSGIEMEKILLLAQKHDYKFGDTVETKQPTVTQDSLFLDESGNPIGFYIRKVKTLAAKYAAIADAELKSDRVPKTDMIRVGSVNNESGLRFNQYSTQLGSIPPQPRLRRRWRSSASTHRHESARTFVKAMLKLCSSVERIIEEHMPEQAARQRADVTENVEPQWRFGTMFTSSISNFNGAAQCHIDRRNRKGTVNAIYTKREASTGGDLFIPAYDATIYCGDDSLIVYPAWRDMHAVTPIIPLSDDGYRNSLIFYPIAQFYDDEGTEDREQV
jgi:hypothetical protein